MKTVEELKYLDNYSFNVKINPWKELIFNKKIYKSNLYTSPSYDIVKNQTFQLKNEIIKRKSKNEFEYIGYQIYLNNIEEYYYDDHVFSGFKKTKYSYIYKHIEDVSKYNYIEYRKNLVGLLLNKIYDDVNNISFTFIPKIIKKNNKKYIISTNELYFDFQDFNKYLENSETESNIIINIFLQIILCLNSINLHYSYSHNNLYISRLMIQELDEEKKLIYNVLLNGNEVKIKIKTKYLVKIENSSNSSIKYYLNKKEYLSFFISVQNSYHPTKIGTKHIPFPELDILDLLCRIFIYGKNNPNINIFKDINQYILGKVIKKVYFNHKNIKHSYDNILYYILYKSELSEFLDFVKTDIF